MVLWVILVAVQCILIRATMREWLSCYLCEYSPVKGRVSDCTCEIDAVNSATVSFFQPILLNLSSLTYFKYFQVDMHSPCPYWKENGMCMMEGCSICTCSDSEIPQTWLQPSEKKIDRTEETKDSHGWISPPNSGYGHSFSKGYDDVLGRVDYNEDFNKATLIDSSNEWILSKNGETFVNLLLNPERYTGYAGPSASRVWQAIQQENCFGRLEDSCLEKRVFYRLMSGLQSSISTHIAKSFYYPPPVDRWGTNLPLFIRAVGAHHDRINNMYFTFLFALRAAQRAKDILLAFPIDSGNATDDALAKDLLTQFLSSSYSTLSDNSLGLHTTDGKNSVQECRHGFDESMLFQVSSVPASYGDYRFDALKEKNDLREDFRLKFRNISAIMNCVSCERCRVWGKLQILGLGTAIKLLLSSAEEISSQQVQLDRQEVIALINTLHQVCSPSRQLLDDF